MKIELLKKVGDHDKGTSLEIKDKAVLKAWVKLGVIKAPKGLEAEKETSTEEKEQEPKTEK